MTRRPREIIERLPGGFLIDIEGNRSIETPEMVAGLILRIWPEVASYISAEMSRPMIISHEVEP